jgi:transposase InsO family protein
VAVDYFTKWVEAEPLATITTKKAINFIWKNIISRFGLPRVIITDRGKQFHNDQFQEFCEQRGIQVHYASKAYPKANGQVEVTNRTIKKNLKKKLEAAKGDWPEELPSVLWAYRTTARTATGETPYSLAYGVEAVIPVEIGLLSHRTRDFQEEENRQGLLEGLDFLEEKRERAAIKMATYQQQMAKFYNSQVRERSFRTGELVLKKVDPTGKRIGHLGPNWEGPYQVTEHVKAGAYRLATLSGKKLPQPWNAEHLKKYFQ